MIIKSLIIAVSIGMCAGCLGYATDMPSTVEVENPLPRVAENSDSSSEVSDRWACQSETGAFEPLSKNYFLNVWGEPKDKLTTETGETWIYEESGRWCGLWLGYIVPIPLVLPVCKTFDKVNFEEGVAVSSHSRRFTRSTMGVVFHPSAFFYPIPIRTRSGKVTEYKAQVRVFPEKEYNLACRA